MKVQLLPAKFSDISLQYFNGDWRDYYYLQFSLYSTAEKALPVTLKIYDRNHPDSNYQYQDRFNLEFELQPGWNDIRQPLETIEQAPQNRDMDMSSIVSVSLFTNELKRPVTVYLDEMRLTR